MSVDMTGVMEEGATMTGHLPEAMIEGMATSVDQHTLSEATMTAVMRGVIQENMTAATTGDTTGMQS
jgi:hypothetical protein